MSSTEDITLVKKPRKPRKQTVAAAPELCVKQEIVPKTEDYETLNTDYYQYHNNKCVTNHTQLLHITEELEVLKALMIAKIDLLLEHIMTMKNTDDIIP